MPVDSDFGGCFKVVVILAVILVVFAWIFVQSGTLETRQEVFIKDGMPYTTTRYFFHWDRFFGYIKALPGRASRLFTSTPDPLAPMK
ncbi:MAG: hypothetical protein OZSIB_0034 [Candidatus Ozemobacter sibiricus]|jgi:hypothetical protein|uniref:Uncharacterized protein n=1 Tax=Candidatus Ozemobacter sibiricus TaxID=2268124 RepID=A0A367ZMN4_9BACT|nr:MAG: hypothetical protein OZSIB_0034 [Candidatus Ozemobacter sibiricus]